MAQHSDRNANERSNDATTSHPVRHGTVQLPDAIQIELELGLDLAPTPRSPQGNPLEQADLQSPRRIPWPIVAVGMVVGLVTVGFGGLFPTSPAPGWGTRVQAETETTHPDPKGLPMAVMSLTLEPTYTVTQTYTGQVAALRTSELGFEHGGTLVWVGADRGDRVRKGAAIARLDTRNLVAQRSQLLAQQEQAMALLTELQRGPRQEDIDAAQSTVRALEDQLELQTIRQTRREFLVNEGAIAREQLDEVTFGAEALADRLEAARSQLQELQTGTRPEQLAAQHAAVKQLTAQIADLDITIEKSTITAPFDGVIGERQHDEGTVLSPGQAVLRLVESAQPEIEIGIPSDRLTTLTPGRSYAVDIGDRTYEAVVSSVLPELDPATRTHTLILRLVTETVTLTPGQIVRLPLTTTVQAPGYWVPTTALTQAEKGLWALYAAVPPQTPSHESGKDTDPPRAEPPIERQVERRIVEVLHTEGDRAFVRGTLSPTDQIIADGTQKVVPGQRIQPTLYPAQE